MKLIKVNKIKKIITKHNVLPRKKRENFILFVFFKNVVANIMTIFIKNLFKQPF